MSFNILCVDDHLDSLDILKVFLELEGYQVTAARSGDEAIALMNQYSYDLYILDVHIPETDGLQLCRMIRASDKEIPIIMYSAGAYQTDIDAACMAGATRYIIKPDGYEQIVPTILELTSN